MGSATVRRIALVAAIVLLVPVWSRPAVATGAPEGADAIFVRLGAGTASPTPAIRRHLSPGWWHAGTRADHGRALVALAVVALLSLLRLVRCSTVPSMRAAPSSLARRRYAIALRAPPLPACA